MNYRSGEENLPNVREASNLRYPGKITKFCTGFQQESLTL